jgi:hypothetical protein
MLRLKSRLHSFDDKCLILKCIRDDTIMFKHRDDYFDDTEIDILYDYKNLTYNFGNDGEHERKFTSILTKQLVYNGKIILDNEHVQMAWTKATEFSPIFNKHCIVLHRSLKKSIFNCETEMSVKFVEFVSIDYKHYYDEALKCICTLDGNIVIKNIGHLFKTNDEIGFLYDKVLVWTRTSPRVKNEVSIYSHWDRQLSHLFLDQSLNKSIVISLMCNNRNRNTRHHIPKYVLFYIFDLF